MVITLVGWTSFFKVPHAMRKRAYLPKRLGGVRVLIKVAGDIWKATNDQLHADTPGLGYRASKDVGDKVGRESFVPWGQHVVGGVDEGDGWVRCHMDEQVAAPKSRAT